MLEGLPVTEQCVIIEGVNFLNNADLDGRALPPPGAPNIMLAAGGTQLKKVFEDDRIYAYQFHVDWSDKAKTKITGPVKLDVAPYHYLWDGQLTKCVSQPGTEIRLDAHGDKLMQRLVYRNLGSYESLAVVHSINTSTGAAECAGMNSGWTITAIPSCSSRGRMRPTDFFAGWEASVLITKGTSAWVIHSVESQTSPDSGLQEDWLQTSRVLLRLARRFLLKGKQRRPIRYGGRTTQRPLWIRAMTAHSGMWAII